VFALRWGSVACLLLGMSGAPAVSGQSVYVEGKHFETLSDRQRSNTDRAWTDVLQFFTYVCVTCRESDAQLTRWANAAGSRVRFSRLPLAPDGETRLHARAFHTAAILGVLDTMHTVLYAVIQDSRSPLESESDVAELFIDNGVDEYWFHTIFNSVDVRRSLDYVSKLASTYEVQHVPTFIVDGAVRVDEERVQSNNADVLAVLGFLVRERDNPIPLGH